jgi:cytochrome c-type biogenesis protein CcmE
METANFDRVAAVGSSGHICMNTSVKLGIASATIALVTVYMAIDGMSVSRHYYLTVDECLDEAAAWTNQRIRVSGRVATGTLQMGGDRRQATFELCSNDRGLPVRCSGSLPDNLAEGKEVVVEGYLDPSGSLQGDKVMTRCASKYVSERPAAAASRSASSGSLRP